MRKILSASVITAGLLVVPAAAQADASLRSEASHLRAQVVHRFGATAPGRDIVRDGFWTGRRARRASRAELRGYVRTLRGMLAPPVIAHRYRHAAAVVRSVGSAVVQSARSSLPYGGGYGSVPGVPPGFASCVAMRESTNGAGSSNIYGILPSNGYSSGMSVAAQKQLFERLYAQSGTAPWTPWDHCG